MDFINNSWPVYVTTWGNPKDHNMHIEIIDKYVDGHMPQTYLEVWGESYMNEPAKWVKIGTCEYRELGAKKPIHHIVSTEYNKITAEQINIFFKWSGKESSIWRVPGTETPLSIWNTWEDVNWDVSEFEQINCP